MKIKALAMYLGIPALFAIGVFIYALGSEPFSMEMVVSVLLGGFLFYAAPYMLWAVIIMVVKVSNVVAHLGILGITFSLFLIACFWFFPSDPSGLPLQWMLYWPLSLIFLLLSAGGTTIYLRIKSTNEEIPHGR